MTILFYLAAITYLSVAIFRLAVNVYIYHNAHNYYEQQEVSRKARRAFLWPLDTLKAIQQAIHGK